VFNGEIYNFIELRREIQTLGHILRTNSDTEVIIHLYEEYGTDCLQKLNGMFAFAIWDERQQRLFLGRDRLGQKPLHYAQVGQSLIFASEIQPILEDLSVPRRLNLEALDQYLTLLYVPSPHTMFQDISKLPPAHFMICERGRVRIERYWQLEFTPKVTLSETALQEQIIALLEDATRLRLISDVPLGAFLSGGIDSTLVVGLMSRLVDQPVKTFSIGFESERQWFHELPYARMAAQHFGTEHTEFVVSPQMADVLPKLVWHYGEPFGDNSSIPTYYISKLTRSQATVALSGDGGDELFGGYGRYTFYQKLTFRKMLRGLMGQTVRDASALLMNPNAQIVKAALARIRERVSLLLGDGRDSMYQFTRLMNHFRTDLKWRLYSKTLLRNLQGSNPFVALYRVGEKASELRGLDKWFYIDIHTYLPDDILVKVDIASMANSLEVRSPFLDYRVVELAASIPANLKVSDETTKRILKQVARNFVPKPILERPKWGFGSPLHEWLRKDLRQVAYDILFDQRARERGLFNANYIKQMFQTHITGKADLGNQLWLLLNFEIWCRTFLDGPLSPIIL
jgi:asparagine synthase (glutamine-hydrolysing)